jgi:hypothetical protein
VKILQVSFELMFTLCLTFEVAEVIYLHRRDFCSLSSCQAANDIDVK